MPRNNPDAPYQRVNILDRGESFKTRAKLIACIHGSMRGGNGYATFLAMNFDFIPMRNYRRARLARIMLQFTSDGTAPEVVDVAPKGQYRLIANRDSEVGPAGIGYAVTRETATAYGKLVDGAILSDDNASSTHNVAHWTIIEEEMFKTGIPERLTLVILLKRADQNLFRMMPKVDVKVSGFDFEEALAGRLPKDDPVIFNPKSASPVWNLAFPSTDIDQTNLEDFWHSHSPTIWDVKVVISAADELRPTESVTAETPVDVTGPRQSHEPFRRSSDDDSGASSANFRNLMQRAIYTELWNVETGAAASSGQLRLEWEDLGDAPDDEKLSEKFSWLKRELELPVSFDILGEQQSFQTNVAENTTRDAQGCTIEISETMHTMCSLLIRKAISRKSFKSFQDLGKELFNQQTVDSIAEFFALEKKDYNGFRKLDFGSCEILSTGEGRELSIFYIIQTPYYSSGFWSMFLVGKADPEDPDRSRKLSGLIQSGADVDLERILVATASGAEAFSYHPLLLPYHLYVNHYECTAKQFDSVLKKVEDVELRIMIQLRSKNELNPQARSESDDDDEDDGQEPTHWGLAKLSKSLHEASMEIAEIARRRQFEDDLSESLLKELDKQRPAQNQMLLDLRRYDRWAKAHQLDIEGMPNRIDSLKNLLYSMISQQDNVVSIKLAREGLSDSKAMKTLSFITILFLPGTFVATLFTTDLVSFQDSAAETRAYIKVVVPLTIVLMILYGVWLGMKPAWSRTRRRMRDPETGSMTVPFFKNPRTASKTAKQS